MLYVDNKNVATNQNLFSSSWFSVQYSTRCSDVLNGHCSSEWRGTGLVSDGEVERWVRQQQRYNRLVLVLNCYM